MKKRLIPVTIMVLVLCSCNDGGSVKIEVDSVGKKFDTAAEKIYDTAKNRLKTLTDKIEDRVNSRDSVDNK
jgi:hypothetical protein